MNTTKQEASTTNGNVGEEAAAVATSAVGPKAVAKPKKAAKHARKVANTGKSKGKKAAQAKHPKATKKPVIKGAAEAKGETKGAIILRLIQRQKGASLQELQAATEWQAHSVRGFLSTASKKQKLTITSAKNEVGERVYTVK